MTIFRYAANQIIPPPASSSAHGNPATMANSAGLVEVAKDVATDLAKEVASGLYYLGT